MWPLFLVPIWGRRALLDLRPRKRLDGRALLRLDRPPRPPSLRPPRPRLSRQQDHRTLSRPLAPRLVRRASHLRRRHEARARRRTLDRGRGPERIADASGDCFVDTERLHARTGCGGNSGGGETLSRSRRHSLSLGWPPPLLRVTRDLVTKSGRGCISTSSGMRYARTKPEGGAEAI